MHMRNLKGFLSASADSSGYAGQMARTQGGDGVPTGHSHQGDPVCDEYGALRAGRRGIQMKRPTALKKNIADWL